MGHKIKLTRHEVLMGANIGVMRRIASYTKLNDNKHTPRDDDTWDRDIEGACAEVAFAKHFNVFWNGSINTFHDPDVGIIQVRHTQMINGCLIVREDDKDYEAFALVTGNHPTFSLRGWMYAGDSKLDRWRRDNFSWFVPQKYLREIDDLSIEPREEPS